jgi:FlgD Ig-like domain
MEDFFMKKYLLFIFLLIPVIIFSQKIYSIPDFQKTIGEQQKSETSESGYVNFFPLKTGDFWEYISDYAAIEDEEVFRSSRTKEILNDTLLSNNKVYKKVLKRYCANSGNPMPEYSFLRKDSIGNIYTFIDGKDYLLYDFTKLVNERFNAPWKGYYWEIGRKYQVIAFDEDTVQAIDMLLFDSLNQQSFFITFIEQYGITYYEGYRNRNINEYEIGTYWGSIINNFQRKELLVAKSEPNWKNYYPLDVGDKWFYLETNYSLLESTLIIEVEKDTLFSDGFIYKKIHRTVTWKNHSKPDEDSFLYERLDSSGNIFRIGNFEGRPMLHFSLCVGDTITHFQTTGEIRKLYNKTRSFWDILTDYEYTLFYNDPWSLGGEDLYFVKNIGLIKRNSEGIFDNLLGAYIAGKLYGDTTITSIKETEFSPIHVSLSQNYPNPFNGTTKIKFNIDKRQTVTLIIYNLNGKEVKKLIYNQGSAIGGHEIIWDGKNNAEEEVASGIYIYSLILERSIIKTKKLIYLK